MKLPKKLIVMKNKDKAFHEKWSASRDMLNFPHPFRCVMSGPPNSGKTNAILNICARVQNDGPAFEKIIVVHQDCDMSAEYTDLDVEMQDVIPGTDEHTENDIKTLIILDDIDFSTLNKESKKNLDRLVGYDSTHKNISVIITSRHLLDYQR